MHLLRVTDLHAMASRETSFLQGVMHQQQRFLDVHMGPRQAPRKPRRQSHTTAQLFPHADVTATADHMQLRPSSLAIHFSLAGIEVCVLSVCRPCCTLQQSMSWQTSCARNWAAVNCVIIMLESAVGAQYLWHTFAPYLTRSRLEIHPHRSYWPLYVRLQHRSSMAGLQCHSIWMHASPHPHATPQWHVFQHEARHQPGSLQVTHSQAVVLAALTFAGHLKRCKSMPLDRAAAQVPAAAPTTALSGTPQTLAEQVLHSFAQNNIPIHQPIMLPLLVPTLDCPGVHLATTHIQPATCQMLLQQNCQVSQPGT